MPLDRRQQKRNLRLFAIARSDINAALHCAQLLQQMATDRSSPEVMRRPEFFPLQHALVITYARPFTPTRTGPRLQGRWARFDTARLNEAHAEVLSMRNAFIAHSDEEQRRVTIHPDGTFQLPGLSGSNIGLGLSVSSIALGPAVVDAIAGCCLDVGRRLNIEVQRLQQELYAGRTDLPSEPFLVTDDDGL